MATKALFRLGFVCGVAAFLLMFLAFATPYWYKSWTRVHSPFSNIGLWHVCLSGYIQPRDPTQKSYVGCWWIHSTEFREVANEIMPPWFRGMQALSVFTLIADLLAGVMLIIYLPDVMYKKIYAGRRVKVLFVAGLLELIAAFLVFIIALTFAEMSHDRYWMPRPWMNYLSWSYGLCVLSGFFSAFSGMFVFILAMIYRDKERGLIGSDTLDTRLERMKKKEMEAAARMNAPPPSYNGAEPMGYRDPSMGYPSTGYPSTGGYRDPSIGGPPSIGAYQELQYKHPREQHDSGSYRDDKISVASSYRDEKPPRGYGDAPVQRPMYGQTRPNFRRGPPKLETSYEGRSGSQSSLQKVGESVV